MQLVWMKSKSSRGPFILLQAHLAERLFNGYLHNMHLNPFVQDEALLASLGKVIEYAPELSRCCDYETIQVSV